MGWFGRALMLALSWHALAESPAWAAEREASLGYHHPALEPLVTRLKSELMSDGYTVRVEVLTAPPTCEPIVPRPSATTARAQVWVRVDHSPKAPNTGCAAISYRGPGSELRHARVTAPISDAQRFALTVAEALNGLSTRPLPPSSQTAPIPVNPPAHPEASSDQQPPALGAWLALLLDVTHPTPLLAVGLQGELPLNSVVALHLDSFWTATPLRLEEGDTSLSASFAWTRLSLALTLLSDPASLKLTAGAGPALSWATADVPPPDVARADVGASALLSVGGAFTYPSDQPVQFGFALRASTLLPSVRLELPSGPSEPFGRLLGEVGIGLLVDL